MLHIKMPSLPISASTTTANGAILPLGNIAKFIRIVNHSATSGVYVNSGGGAVTATNANVAIPPFGEKTLEIGDGDTHVAALLISGTAIISVSICGAD